MLVSSLILKLWDKGVDIAAGVITSVLASIFIAVIGLFLWEVKLGLDLRADARKQRQQHDIAEEFDREKRRQDTRDRQTRLRQERDEFVKAVPTLGREGQAILWESYINWIRANNLDSRNPRAYELAGWSPSLRLASDANAEANARNMERMMRETDLRETQ
jgi:hypothetical protein